MRRISVSGIGGGASIIGMGCASLGSRVGRAEGLRALERAFDAGITWFDVAPSYGDAEAEIILGEFVRGKRQNVEICTKLGIRPAHTPFAMRAVKPVLRHVLTAVPVLRKYVTRARPAAAKLPITVEMISASVDASLRRLATDHIEVLALHEADADEVVRDDVLAALDRVVRHGKAKTIAIASSIDVGLLGATRSEIFGIVQVANNPFEPSLAIAAERPPLERAISFVTHSAYGAFGALQRIREIIHSNASNLRMLRDAGYSGPSETIAATFLADYALATNNAGVTLFSMFKKEHLDFNLQRLERLPEKAQLEKLTQQLIAP